MTPTDEMAARTDFDDQFEEQLRAIVKETSLQPRIVENLHGSEDVQSLLSRHLDYESSARRAIYHRLQAIESAVKRRRSRGIVRYLVAIGIGVLATLAWQSYGEEGKQIIAAKAPELGWSPESKQLIASWVQQLGWTKQPTSPESTAVQTSAPEPPQPALASPPAAAHKPTPTAPPSSRAPTPPR
jgi:hypothetical protein